MAQPTILNGNYFITNAGTYLASNGNGATASLQNARDTSFQIWAIGYTPAGYLIRNYGTGGFLVPDGAGSVTTQLPEYFWILPANSQLPNTYSIEDYKNTMYVLGTTPGSQGSNPSIAYEAQSSTDATQCWTFTVTAYPL